MGNTVAASRVPIGTDLTLATLLLTMPRRRTRRDEFDEFFLANFGTIASSVAIMCGDAERANDATQEAFVRAYARWGRVRSLDNPAAWIRRIAINATRDSHRSDQRRARREEHAARTSVVVPAAEPQASPLDLLASLSERQRAIAALYYLDDLSVGEISVTLGIAEGTVRFHLSEARVALRTALQPTHPAGGLEHGS